MDSQSLIVLGNAYLKVWLDPATGRIMAVHNVPRDLDLVSAVLDTPPWRLEVQPEGRWIESFASFSWLNSYYFANISDTFALISIWWTNSAYLGSHFSNGFFVHTADLNSAGTIKA